MGTTRAAHFGWLVFWLGLSGLHAYEKDWWWLCATTGFAAYHAGKLWWNE